MFEKLTTASFFSTKTTCMKLFISAIMLLLGTSCFSQNTHFKKGQATLQAGIGFFSNLDATISTGQGIAFPLKMPPLSISADFAITDAVSLGGYIGRAVSDVNMVGLFETRNLGTMNYTIIGARGLYHFDLTKSLDTYGGAMLGYTIMKEKGNEDEYETESNMLAYNFLVGAKYSFTPNVGAFVEFGYGVAALNLGVFLKLK